jgi:hypothetical protein
MQVHMGDGKLSPFGSWQPKYPQSLEYRFTGGVIGIVNWEMPISGMTLPLMQTDIHRA